jgi:16S rRNA (cytosine967-C5)-methyltransferase
MKFIWQHISAILDQYDGSVPLAYYLKNYFKQRPILGSRDRRVISAMVYSWYRCSKGFGDWPEHFALQDRVGLCMALCGATIPEFLKAQIEEIVSKRLVPEFKLDRLYEGNPKLSEGIKQHDWLNSMLRQPQLFIRVRKDIDKIVSLLDDAAIPVSLVADKCIALPNGAKIDQLLPADCYVVQDASSQATGAYFQPKKNEQWYDCCAGAGGKSLLLKDIEPGVSLVVSDKRDSIIHNLLQRFRLYRHILPTAVIADAANTNALNDRLGNKRFDGIICDVPCSGSGTWARTPEALYFAEESKLSQFPDLQSKIAINAAHYLKPGGKLYYITCSVFSAENEAVVARVTKATNLVVLEMKLINGLAIGADSMFIAVLTKQKSDI